MTNFTKTRLTDKGLALLAKEGVSVTITKVKTGNGEYQEDEDIGGMTDLKSVKQEFSIISATEKSDTMYSIKFAMSNKELTEDYLFTEVGVYAVDPDEGEVLYAVCYAANENADMIRKFNGLFEFKAIIVLNIAVNAGGTVRIVSEGVYALAEDLDNHVNDKVCHITQTEREKWNSVTDLEKEISYLKEQGKTTIFNSDGSITEKFDNGMIKNITFNNGSITEKLTKDGSVINTKTTIFNTDGSIKEVVEWAGQK